MSNKSISQLKTYYYSLEEIFSEENYFIIPNYQRGYAWERQHVDMLWNDIMLVKAIEQSHYMGALTLTRTKEDTKETLGLVGKNCYDVIDGQQRLTTLVIILSVLSEQIDEVKDKFLKNKDTNKYYLYYGEGGKNREFLLKNIYSDGNLKPKNMYQKNLNDAKQNITEKLANINDEEKLAIYNSIIKKMKFSIYLNASDFDERKTFETMNYRGKTLTNLELLKNKLIYLSTKITEGNKELIPTITTAWEQIYENLGFNPEKMLPDDEYLKAHWIIYGKADVNLKAKGNAYAEDILNNYFSDGSYNKEENRYEVKEISKENILEYVESLRDCSEQWKAVKYPMRAKQDLNLKEQEVKWLDKLSRIRSFIYVDALILATLKNCRKIDFALRIELYETLEKFIFINYCICSKRNDMSFCMSVARDIFNCNSEQENNTRIKEFIEFLRNGHDIAISRTLPHALERLENEISKDYYGSFIGREYFLYEYNRSLVEKELYEDRGVERIETTEHILPAGYKRIESWNLVLKNYEENWENNERERIINCLGNLVGLKTIRKNTSMGNKSYKIKRDITEEGRPCYKKGTLAEIEIAENNETWTVKSIYNRTKELLEFMFEIWFKGFDEKLDEQINKKENKLYKRFIPFDIKESHKEQNILEKELLEIYDKESNAFKSSRGITDN